MLERKLNDEIAKLQREKKTLEEQVAMLMHNQKLRSEAGRNNAAESMKSSSSEQK